MNYIMLVQQIKFNNIRKNVKLYYIGLSQYNKALPFFFFKKLLINLNIYLKK